MNNHLDSKTCHLCVKNLRNSSLLRAFLALIWQLLNPIWIIRN